jgi:CRP/FNR family transcriptional regulator
MRVMSACDSCAFKPLCFPRGVPAGTPPVESRRRLARGEALFLSGDPCMSIYAVRAGFLKESVPRPDGGSHIIRFLLPGDAAGLDTRVGESHRSEVVAIADCQVCEIPAYRAEILCDFNPRIASHIRGHIALELTHSRRHATSLACQGVRQRIAGFLIDLGRRWMARGYSACSFMLPMTRREIAEHLALTPETVSRVLREFEERGWIDPRRRSVDILDERALAEVASG